MSLIWKCRIWEEIFLMQVETVLAVKVAYGPDRLHHDVKGLLNYLSRSSLRPRGPLPRFSYRKLYVKAFQGMFTGLPWLIISSTCINRGKSPSLSKPCCACVRTALATTLVIATDSRVTPSSSARASSKDNPLPRRGLTGGSGRRKWSHRGPLRQRLRSLPAP